MTGLAQLKAAGASIRPASITSETAGGFVAVASTGSVDRDGEIVAPGALTLPPTVPVHLGHKFDETNIVARARPYYQGDRLMIEATFGSTALSQEARTMVKDGLLADVSIVFRAAKRENVRGVVTVTSGELLAVDLVTMPSNRDARVLSARSLGYGARSVTRRYVAEALLALADAEIADARAVLVMSAAVDRRGRQRRRTDSFIRTLAN